MACTPTNSTYSSPALTKSCAEPTPIYQQWPGQSGRHEPHKRRPQLALAALGLLSRVRCQPHWVRGLKSGSLSQGIASRFGPQRVPFAPFFPFEARSLVLSQTLFLKTPLCPSCKEGQSSHLPTSQLAARSWCARPPPVPIGSDLPSGAVSRPFLYRTYSDGLAGQKRRPPLACTARNSRGWGDCP